MCLLLFSVFQATSALFFAGNCCRCSWEVNHHYLIWKVCTGNNCAEMFSCPSAVIEIWNSLIWAFYRQTFGWICLLDLKLHLLLSPRLSVSLGSFYRCWLNLQSVQNPALLVRFRNNRGQRLQGLWRTSVIWEELNQLEGKRYFILPISKLVMDKV